MSEKRSAKDQKDQPRVKRSRFDSDSPVPSVNGVASKVQNGNVAGAADQEEKLRKAREILGKKEALKAQLQALKERAAARQSANAQASALPATQGGPAPLRLDNQGRELDAQGNVIERPKPRPPPKPAAAAQASQAAAPQVKAVNPEDFVDPHMSSSLQRQRRRRPGLDFVKAGTFQKDAEQQRLKAALGEDALKQQARQREEDKRRAAQDAVADPNLVPLGTRAPAPEAAQPVEEAIPNVEWWDSGLLANPGSYPEEQEEGYLQEGKITIYVEHPVPLDPVGEAPLPPPMPLPLTAKEKKKLRTQRRVEAEKEKQELIRQGLLEPPKPRMKLGTFYRSMGTQASLNPTAVEQQVRQDQQDRLQAHDDRNLANKLTPAEKRDKKIKKLTGAATEVEVTHVSVYRVVDLENKSHRFKVRVSAEELHMTGCAVITDKESVIVVEGGVKAQKKYAHVVLNRVKWNKDQDEADDDESTRPTNSCTRMWTGTVKEPVFDKFVLEVCRTEEAGRKFLEDRGIRHYWDLAMADREED